MIIVSNTGPLIGLAKIQQLGLLGRLAREVYIPPQVRLELFARTGPETVLIAAALKAARPSTVAFISSNDAALCIIRAKVFCYECS